MSSTPAGLYVHIPFCSAICPYCDFAVTTGGRERRERYVRSLLQELELAKPPATEVAFDTLYFGGGTPSALAPAEIEKVVERLRQVFVPADDLWISLEANPEDLTPRTLEAWRTIGVRTVSLGVQSFNAEELRFLGRRHAPATSRASIEEARGAGFHTVSVDLIFGLPGQRLSTWRRTLEEAVSLGPDHVSCYQLTVHEGTPFARHRARGKLDELSNEAQAELFLLTHEVLEGSGYEAYEVSNFARGGEHRSRHNRKYWSHSPYLGFGVSAHSFDGRRRWWNERAVRDYEQSIEKGKTPVVDEETLSDAQLALETLMLGLRTVEGIDIATYRERFGVDIVTINAERIETYCREGLAQLAADRLRLTRYGLAVADAMAASLQTGLDC